MKCMELQKCTDEYVKSRVRENREIFQNNEI
jgi:hypothetical protein